MNQPLGILQRDQFLLTENWIGTSLSVLKRCLFFFVWGGYRAQRTMFWIQPIIIRVVFDFGGEGSFLKLVQYPCFAVEQGLKLRVSLRDKRLYGKLNS